MSDSYYSVVSLDCLRSKEIMISLVSSHDIFFFIVFLFASLVFGRLVKSLLVMWNAKDSTSPILALLRETPVSQV